MENIKTLITILAKRYCTFEDKNKNLMLVHLLDCSIKRVLMNLNRRAPLQVGLDQIAYDPYHIADWLKTAIINEEPWLKNVDSLGRPKKLVKCGSLEALYSEADKAMMKAIQRNGSVDLVESDEELFMELDDGYRLVRLLTARALDREGREMQHCIGGGSYDEDIEDGTCLYLSLRDRFNKPHATLEILVEDMALAQLQGKQNKIPDIKYGRLLSPFINEHKIKDERGLYHNVYKFDENGNIYDLYSLPDGATISGYYYIGGDDGVKRLPNNLKVKGDMQLKNCDISELPRGLQVQGELFIVNCPNIRAVPDDTRVGKRLLIKACPNIKEVSNYTTFLGSIEINGYLQKRGTLDIPKPYVGF